MAMADRYGLPVSTSSALALEEYQAGADRLLSYGPDAEAHLARAVAADDGLALAHAALAAYALLQGDAGAARSALAAAERSLAGASRRERQHVAALGAIAGGDSARGLELIREHLADFPRDALLVNQASSAIGFSGRADREAERLAFVEALQPAYGDDWWYQSALSFTYHEVDRFEESRRLSVRSLEQYPGNAHASHNLAHVDYETADNEGGAAFLEGWLAGYDRRAPFHCHLAWHLALFELQRGHEARALQIFERDIARSASPRHTVMDGTALLWRFMIYGCEAGPLPWAALGETAARIARPSFVFGEIHAAFAYAATGDQRALSAMADSLRAMAAKGHPIAGTVVVPLVEAAAAYAAGDYGAAVASLEPVEPELHRIGGSHAQWEIFEETMIACYLKLGRAADALRLVRRRVAARPSPRDLRWLAEAEQAAGTPPSAADAAAAGGARGRRG